jgi:hypothetical protein
VKMGSARMARCAGRYEASAETLTSNNAAATGAAGSSGCAPNSRPRRRRVASQRRRCVLSHLAFRSDLRGAARRPA